MSWETPSSWTNCDGWSPYTSPTSQRLPENDPPLTQSQIHRLQYHLLGAKHKHLWCQNQSSHNWRYTFRRRSNTKTVSCLQKSWVLSLLLPPIPFEGLCTTSSVLVGGFRPGVSAWLPKVRTHCNLSHHSLCPDPHRTLNIRQRLSSHGATEMRRLCVILA